jgi:RNase P/RNase MRP subunit p30
MDIVFPKGNEEKFIETAKKLRYNSLCFVYNIKDFSSIKKDYDFDIKYGVICSEKDTNKAKKLSKLVFVKSPINPRHLIENNKGIIVFDLELSNDKDSLHQKRSGLNHILCSLCTKNDITIGFSFDSLLNIIFLKREVVLGRIAANIGLCRKYKVETIIGSFARDPYEMRDYNDLKSLFLVL